MCLLSLKINSWKPPHDTFVYMVLIRIYSWDAEKSNLYFGWPQVQQKLFYWCGGRTLEILRGEEKNDVESKRE